MRNRQQSAQTAPDRRCSGIPHNTWYAVATTEEVGRSPLARTVLGQRVVLYRATDGRAVALADRCAHRPVPLSNGEVAGDDIVAAYTGFRYDPDGQCVAVPTQTQVPFGASVHAYPVHDDGTFVWIWPGDLRLASRRSVPHTSWLRDDAWGSFGQAWETRSSLRLMHDNFADITHVALVDPDIAPPALLDTPPPLEVQVTETTVSFFRDFPPAAVSTWHAELLGLSPDSEMPQREEGSFVTPGLWVDRWSVELPGGGQARFVFTHALTPVSETVTRHVWRVSRDFATSAAANGTLVPIFERYYARVRAALETMQTMLDEDGQRPEVRLAADVAGSHVHRIMARMVAEETGAR